MHTITIKGLTKSFRKFRALDGIDLQIGPGLFGLLGPNGAGKTTLMKVLSTSSSWSDGKVTVYGFDLLKEGDKVRELLGYLPQQFQTPHHFTGGQLLHYIASMKGVLDTTERTKQVERVLREVNLEQHANKRIKAYSGGMKRRLGIAQALLGNPKLIIFDEPTAGLDPSERIRFRNLIERLSKECTIILSTHIISDIESTCEKVAVMNNGEVHFQGSVEELAQIAENVVWELHVPISEYDLIERDYVIISSRREGDHVLFRVISKVQPHHLAKTVSPSLEDGYMAILNGVI
ncbi:ABC transporter ATP-binding protein [Sporosarcina limicola]|uniref:ABC-type multidrug transport system ATPase subunit n=1 Tax=Sporosarcina limicola TaxID=34101 RepID=A0A927R4E6_9BACL|nr:ABC transporter ATP-binding protein [Sporosarcina limicola]MBE1556111.1 ABC-type multidrug transport system ATPase subunit [Sporosarcina limicola]